MNYSEYSKKRDELGLTDYAVSALTRVSKATLSQWKNGNSSPSLNTLKRINYLLKNYDPNNSYPENYFILGSPAIKAHTNPDDFPPTASGTLRFDNHIDIPDYQPFLINGYFVELRTPKPIEFTTAEYKELRQASEAFALAWLRIHKKLDY